MDSLKAPSLQSLLESDRGSNDSLLAESLQLDFDDQIDDAEYSIPAVDFMPSLETVLSELDSDIGSEDFFGMGNERSAAATPTPSIAPSTSTNATAAASCGGSCAGGGGGTDEGGVIGSILRHCVMQGVSAQIASAADRIHAGLASSMALSGMIAIGTSHGFILAFDLTQTLRWCCKEFTTQGSVSALAFNPDSTRLLAGFARNHIIMIDTSTGNVIRSLPDAITPNTAVLNLRWTNRPAFALCTDSGGSMWSLNFTRRLGIRGCESRCLFSGARGEVCAMEPLMYSTSVDETSHPLHNYCLVALATLSKFFVVMVRPRLRVIRFHPMVGPADMMPLLSWHMVLIQAADTSRSIDPVLASARGMQLHFHQVHMNSSGKITLLTLRHIQLGYNLLAIHWLGPKSLALLDQSEMLHLMDVRSSRELECIDIVSAGLVYNSAEFKALATGGNVSPALALSATHACYNSVAASQRHLYVMGARSLHTISVRPWSDRITHLSQRHRWTDACHLALDGFRSTKNKDIARRRIIQFVEDYLQETTRTPEVALDSIVPCLIEVDSMDLLWNDIWERLKRPDEFLKILTKYIVDGNVVMVAPHVAQELCTFWRTHSTQTLESLLLKLDWRCLDLHQAMSVVKEKNLFLAQIHLSTSVLNDFTMPLIELIPLIDQDRNNESVDLEASSFSSELDAFSETASLIGGAKLQTGGCNPRLPIDVMKSRRALGNTLLVFISCCLAGRRYPTVGEIEPELVVIVKHEVWRLLTSIHSRDAPDNEKSYPYLRRLLHFDMRETMNVLALAFQESEFQGDLGLQQRQRIVNILQEIIVQDVDESWPNIAFFYQFLAQQLAIRNLPKDSVDSSLECLLTFLKSADGSNCDEVDDREKIWLELLHANLLTHIDASELIQLTSATKCFGVLIHLYESLGDFGMIVECFLKMSDKRRQVDVFAYIHRYALIGTRKILPQVIKNIKQLVVLDHVAMSKVALDHYCDNIHQFLKLTDDEPYHQYRFIAELLRIGGAQCVQSEYLDIYLDLLCQYQPDQVKSFLSCADHQYKIENALEIVRRHHMNEAAIYLYERQQDFQSAFQLSMEILKEAEESVCEESALNVSALCARASPFLTEEQRIGLWFPLLEIVLARSDLTSITRNILHAASAHVEPAKLVQLVLTTSGSSNFGDIKHLLVSMLSNSKYETMLLETTSRIFGNDLHQRLAKERKEAARAIHVKSIKCVVCRMHLRHKQQDVVVFGPCGHAVHEECFKQPQLVGGPNVQCPRCGCVINDCEEMKLAVPKANDENFFSDGGHGVSVSDDAGQLHLAAPPRVGIGVKYPNN